jgi:hypothetical protein
MVMIDEFLKALSRLESVGSLAFQVSFSRWLADFVLMEANLDVDLIGIQTSSWMRLKLGIRS